MFEAKKPEGKKKVILVYFIGGVTFAEISCLRYLTMTSGILFVAEFCVGIQFIVATTQFINGNKMIKAFEDEQGNKLRPDSLLDCS